MALIVIVQGVTPEWTQKDAYFSIKSTFTEHIKLKGKAKKHQLKEGLECNISPLVWKDEDDDFTHDDRPILTTALLYPN